MLKQAEGTRNRRKQRQQAKNEEGMGGRAMPEEGGGVGRMEAWSRRWRGA